MKREQRNDLLGFPMIWIPEIEAYVHRFPVTKLQFEVFLSDLPDERFGGDWYSQITAVNPRIPSAQISSGNYWSSLMTGLNAQEALRFARWFGDGYKLPTERDWAELPTAASKPRSGISSVRTGGRWKARRTQLIQDLERVSEELAASTGRNLVGGEPRFLDLGVYEWVEKTGRVGEWTGRGAPHPAFFANLTSFDERTAPPEDEEIRRSPFGFRLLYREEGGSRVRRI